MRTGSRKKKLDSCREILSLVDSLPELDCGMILFESGYKDTGLINEVCLKLEDRVRKCTASAVRKENGLRDSVKQCSQIRNDLHSQCVEFAFS